MTAPPGRVAVIGLDCATPSLLFDRFAADMPTLTRLREQALWGPLRSIVPPITVPAWSCMMSGLTPGELGIYGFRNRADHRYSELAIATSASVRPPRIWDLLGRAGRNSVVLGVPGTYPPPPVRGSLVSCLLTPPTATRYTFPSSLAGQVREVAPGYQFDLSGFRTSDKAALARRLFDFSEQHFRLAGHLARTREWDLFAFVDMGPDRLHHGFWKHCDPNHPRHEPGNAFVDIFRDYYRALDDHLAQLLDSFPDGTTVMIVSDHGAQPMTGGFRLNTWLMQQGLLKLLSVPAAEVTPRPADIDWSKTIAWAEGGYYGRIFLNIEGREPQGIVAPSDVDHIISTLADLIESIVDHEGNLMGNRAWRPEDLYPEVRGIPPDLMVYFGDLRWRATGSVGPDPSLYTFDNDTGPDEANHSDKGIFVLAGQGLEKGRRDDLSLYDVAPTLQRLLGIKPPQGQRGRILT